MTKKEFNIHILTLLAIAKKAGEEIRKIYHSEDISIQLKQDNSPLTKADQQSHTIIMNELSSLDGQLKNLPILSEEGKHIAYDLRKKWDRFWLVDPLDGTKEFLNRNGEFTVNIALIESGIPAIGLVYAPIHNKYWFGGKSFGSYTCTDDQDSWIQIGPRSSNNLNPNVIASRSHMDPNTHQYLEKVKNHFGTMNLLSSGSSIKLCSVAEGAADVYPRFAPTMEWDTAAAHGVCEGAGCRVIDINTKKELRYNKENLLNPSFIVCRKQIFLELL